jgi:hypothetical protein
MRPVPRNIDRPNRAPEYAFTFLVCWYTPMFLFQSPLLSFVCTVLGIYGMYRLTLNKPEGYAYRLLFRAVQIGKMMPNPRNAPKFEI